MLKEAAGISKIYIACGFTDLRMGIDGLTDLIRERFSLDPLEKGTLFLFCGRKSDRIKAVIDGKEYEFIVTGRYSSFNSPSATVSSEEKISGHKYRGKLLLER